MQVILFTDIVASTRVTHKIGDAAAYKLIRAHNMVVRKSLRNYRGREIKHTGDGIMAVFGLASGAVDCAVAIQRRLALLNERTAIRLRVSIGINAGEPILDDNDLFGGAVQVAARLCDNARGGEVVVSEVIRLLLLGKNYKFIDIGRLQLKGIDYPVQAHKVDLSGTRKQRAPKLKASRTLV